MNVRWAWAIAVSMVVFGCLVITWQIHHYNSGLSEPFPESYSSISCSAIRGSYLGKVANISDRSAEYYRMSGIGRYLDLVLPGDAHVFMSEMTGRTNQYKLPFYYYLNYHLFPREVEATLDRHTQLTKNGFSGIGSGSDQEMRTNGFDVRLDVTPDYHVHPKIVGDVTLQYPVNPPWFDSRRDIVIAFLLPLLTAFAGMWLFRLLFPGLNGALTLPEQLACSLGLGMMAVAAFTLGLKLCGLRTAWLVLGITAVAAAAELWRDRRVVTECFLNGNRPGWFFLLPGVAIFAVLFHVASLEGLTDPDAAMAWLLKAKVFHLYTGDEIVRWFSNPRFALANLDYPTLVPSLHAATYDSIGHVNDFVAKFWALWSLFFLLAALASFKAPANHWRHILAFSLLAVLLLPAIQRYGQMEGGTVPMIFFTVLGFVQCLHWLTDRNVPRLALGLTLLFGAAMVKCEGFVFLALVVAWMFLAPSARPPLTAWKGLGRMVPFWVFAALPFFWLRTRIPPGYQSAWSGLAVHHPLSMLANWPAFFLIQLSSLFVNRDLAKWNGDYGHLQWQGGFHGFDSLYNHPTLGLAWLCLGLSAVAWFAAPTRRNILAWIIAMPLAAVAALSVVFASFVCADGLGPVIALYGDEMAAGRYLWPVLFGWFASLLVFLIAAQTTDTAKPVTGPAAKNPGLPTLKGSPWLIACGVAVILLGVFIGSGAPTPDQAPAGNSATEAQLGDADDNSQEKIEVEARAEVASDLAKSGEYAKSIEVLREAAQMYPTNPIALNNLAWHLTVAPIKELRNGAEAVQFATKAVSFTDGRQASYVGTLAAAYAEDGQFAKAVEMAEKARSMALISMVPSLAARNDQLIKLYSTGKSIASGDE